MARIRSITKVTSGGRIHPTEVDAEWSVANFPGPKLLQISTFGSDSRVSRPKVSQTIQIDRKTALILIEAFRETFPGIESSSVQSCGDN